MDGSGVLRCENVIFFNEGFFIIPVLLQCLVYQSEDTRHEFLAKVHEGDAVMKIWDMVKYFELTAWYPIELDNVTKRYALARVDVCRAGDARRCKGGAGGAHGGSFVRHVSVEWTQYRRGRALRAVMAHGARGGAACVGEKL